jgi:hypothetical protein
VRAQQRLERRGAGGRRAHGTRMMREPAPLAVVWTEEDIT